MKKKTWNHLLKIALVLMLAVIVGMVPGKAEAEENSNTGIWGGIRWTFVQTAEDGTGTLTISKLTEEETPETDPKTGQPYERGFWRESVFYNNSGVATAVNWDPIYITERVTKLVIEEGVTGIGSFVAQDMPLTVDGEVRIPKTVKYIGQEAFMGSGITKLTFETYADGTSDLTCIAQGAFKKLKVEEFIFPEGLVCIHAWLACVNPNLEKIVMPESINQMSGQEHLDYDGFVETGNGGAALFAGCKNLRSITFKSESDRNEFLNSVMIGEASTGTSDKTYIFEAFTGLVGYAYLEDAINAAISSGEPVTMLQAADTIGEGRTIIIPQGVTLVIPSGKELTLAGTIINFGRIECDGKINVTGKLVQGNGGELDTSQVNISGSENCVEAYTISYDLNGGTVSGNNPTYYYEGMTSVTLTNPTQYGYEFIGWSGTGLEGNTNTTVSIPTVTSGAITLTANWSGIEYPLAFNTNGGSEMDTIMVKCGDPIVLPANPTKPGYFFTGWDQAVPSTMPAGGLTLTARWMEIPVIPQYNVVIEDDVVGGNVQGSSRYAMVGSRVRLMVVPEEGYELDALTVMVGSKEIEVTFENGAYYYTMPGGDVKVNAAFSKIMPDLTDAAEDAYYYEAVKWAVKSDVMELTSTTTFSPNQKMTRAEAIIALWEAAGSPEPVGTELKFKDVDADSEYYKAVLWAVENGITKGVSKNKFNPDANCSRAQFITFLWRLDKSPAVDKENPFKDVAEDKYYTDAVLWAAEEGITTGKTETTFEPGTTANRAHVVTFLYRLLGEK